MAIRKTQSPGFPKRGFTTPQAGDYIGRSASWLRKRRMRGRDDPGDPGPPWISMPTGSAIYLREDLDQWLDDLAVRARATGARP